ncbi:uncharacterized protein RCO7_14636 [Rhynchosporium graminicola]|uniref:N-acetyltransferase domain-containing protein n=1 Tax=Rhynchosporium graminicola TaxID=2792576 RepID=A0A1E1KTF2_9HELO|nr:uncharacterized protein RCO7_14636 [Rhynchosporium commune]
MGVQLLAAIRCDECHSRDRECWLHFQAGLDLISTPGTSCASFRVNLRNPPCSLSSSTRAPRVGGRGPRPRRLSGSLLTRVDGVSSQVLTAHSAPSRTQILGTLFMDAIDLSIPAEIARQGYLTAAHGESSATKVHLRSSVVDEDARGSGLGSKMLDKALDCADRRGFEYHLWAFRGLDVANRLRGSNVFRIKDQVVRALGMGRDKNLLGSHFVRARAGWGIE